MVILILIFQFNYSNYFNINKQKRFGLDLFEGKIRDNRAFGVFEPAISKIKCLKFATEAAITILRIDDMIKLAPEQKGQGGHPHDDME